MDTINNKNQDAANCEHMAFSIDEDLALYKLKTILQHLNMSTFDYDIASDTIYVHKEAVLLHDFTTHWFKENGDYYCLENMSEQLSNIIRDSFLPATLQKIEEVKNNTSGMIIAFDAPITYKNGNTRWTSFVLDTILDDNGVPVRAVGYCKDIHQQKKELYRLRKIAETDSLTGFRNRSAGIYRIQTKLTEQKDDTFFFAVIDLDKFKDANDLFGHSFGDLILKNVSERIGDFDDHEAIVSRTGGDEFLFFRKCEDVDDALKRATELKKHIQHSVSYQGSTFNVDASIGVSVYPVQGTDFDTLYNKADTAMYYAKNNKVEVSVLYEDTMASVRK